LEDVLSTMLASRTYWVLLPHQLLAFI
jgi:hypothetical protein